jgi:PEGA domain
VNSAFCIISCLLLIFQTGNPSTPAPTAAPQASQASGTSALVAACKPPCLEDGTPVHLKFGQTVSSADANVGDRVEFEVMDEVRVSDVVVINKGGIAWGTVTEAKPKRHMGRGGKLEIVMDSVRLVDGEKAALRATKEAQGGGHKGVMTAGIVATGVIFFPAAPFFLLMHGKDITIPKDAQVPTFVNGNFELDLSKFQPAPAAPTPAAAGPSTSASPAAANPAPPTAAPSANAPTVAAAPATNAEVTVTSNPAGAEIQLDGAFVGNTPSTISVPPGDHTIQITMSGYNTWERKINVTTGKVTIAADLEVATPPPAAPPTSPNPPQPQ